MADRSDAADSPSGTATNLAQQASGRAHSVASWLEEHEPADAFDEVARFARQRPGMFLALAAVGGLLAGRITRGLTSDSSSTDATASGGRGSPTSSTADSRLGDVDAGSSRQAYAGPSFTEPVTSTVTSAADEVWPFDEGMQGGTGTASDGGLGLPDERGADQISSGFAGERDEPYDQGRR